MFCAAETIPRSQVARRMDRFNTTRQSLSVSFACPSYFTVDFTNPYGQQACGDAIGSIGEAHQGDQR